MEVAVIVLSTIVVLLAVLVVILHRRNLKLLDRIETAIPFLKKGGVSPSALDLWLQPLAWTVVAKGGDDRAGVIDGIGMCPCQHEYTVETQQTTHTTLPTPAQIQACVNNPPPTDPPVWDCPEGCTQVKTHVWHGWRIVFSSSLNQYRLNCSTYAQYHCKRPDDPEADKPPVEGPPGEGPPQIGPQGDGPPKPEVS